MTLAPKSIMLHETSSTHRGIAMKRLLSSSRRDATNHADPEGAGSGRREGARASALVRAVAIAGVVGLCAMVLPAAASALPNTGIKGSVTNSSTHSPIAGVEVCAVSIGGGAERKCAQTKPNGEYEIKELKEEEYRVEFTASGYEQTSYSVKVKASETKEANVELNERTGNISGRVTNASNGQGLGGIEVCAQGTSGSCAETNGNGEYTIYDLSVGTYTVSFSPDRYSRQFSSSCEEELEVKVRCTGPNVIGQSASSVSVKASE
ncbi:MAG: collagen binding domain-containing protein, partial [Solirubrobacteraceae bacterium]